MGVGGGLVLGNFGESPTPEGEVKSIGFVSNFSRKSDLIPLKDFNLRKWKFLQITIKNFVTSDEGVFFSVAHGSILTHLIDFVKFLPFSVTKGS